MNTYTAMFFLCLFNFLCTYDQRMNKIRETHGWRFIMTVREYLDRHQARYVWNTHPNTYTAQDLAQQLHRKRLAGSKNP
ncbi:MAG: hypothetical protein KatS3mg104_1865 [Phycisphaerae bacterium]|nr:MAG: hypothetical protein KatS3mg104_1865 [Phycisphaerae bacterium]